MTNLAEVLSSVNGNSIISISTMTNVKLRGGKKNPMQGRVKKRTMGSNVMVFQNKRTNGYGNMVKRRLEAEGKSAESFQLSPRTWGQRITNTPFVEHKGNYYLEVIFLRAGQVDYFLDGNIIDPSEIEGFPSQPEEGKQGGLDNKVIVRSYSVDSIFDITINKQYYDDITFDLER
jgi:hypothetical protein